MLNKIADLSKGIISKVIIFGIAFIFVFWGASSYLVKNAINQPVATVNGQVIGYSELSRELRMSLLKLQGSGFNKVDLKNKILDELIDRKLLGIAVNNYGFRLNDKAVDHIITMQSQWQDEQGDFSLDLFNKNIENLGYNPYFFKKLFKSLVLNEQLINSLFLSSFITNEETNSYYNLIFQERDINYFKLSKTKITLAQLNNISNVDIKQYYTKHLNQFKIPERIKLGFVTYSLKDRINKIKISPEKVQDYYKTYKEQFVTPGAWHIAHILLKNPDDPKTKILGNKIIKKLKKGGSFEKLAEKYNQDIGENRNGDLGWVEAEEIPDLITVVNGLNKDNSISNLVKTKYGYQIIKLINKRPEMAQNFVEVKDQIINKLKYKLAVKEYSLAKEDISNLAYEENESLKSIEEEYNLKPKVTKWVSRDSANIFVGANNKNFIDIAFSDDVLEQRNNSDVFSLGNNEFIVFRVVAYDKPHVQELSEVTDKIRRILAKQQSLDNLRLKSAHIVKFLDQHKKQNKYKLKEFHNVRRNDSSADLSESVINAVFSLPKNKLDKYQILQTNEGDIVLFNVVKIMLPQISLKDIDLSKEEYSKFIKSFEQQLQNQETVFFIKQLRKKAVIKKFPDIIAQVQ